MKRSFQDYHDLREVDEPYREPKRDKLVLILEKIPAGGWLAKVAHALNIPATTHGEGATPWDAVKHLLDMPGWDQEDSERESRKMVGSDEEPAPEAKLPKIGHEDWERESRKRLSRT